jgi:hypothetical protein
VSRPDPKELRHDVVAVARCGEAPVKDFPKDFRCVNPRVT